MTSCTHPDGAVRLQEDGVLRCDICGTATCSGCGEFVGTVIQADEFVAAEGKCVFCLHGMQPGNEDPTLMRDSGGYTRHPLFGGELDNLGKEES